MTPLHNLRAKINDNRDSLIIIIFYPFFGNKNILHAVEIRIYIVVSPIIILNGSQWFLLLWGNTVILILIASIIS